MARPLPCKGRDKGGVGFNDLFEGRESRQRYKLPTTGRGRAEPEFCRSPQQIDWVAGSRIP